MLLELGRERGSPPSYPRGPFRLNLQTMQLRPAVGDISPSYLGLLDQSAYWNAVFRLYRRDELAGALEMLESLGIGVFADYAATGDIVYIEAATAAESEVVRIRERLEIEVVAQELPCALDVLADVVLKEYLRVRDVFGDYCPKVNTLVTLLLSGAKIPTASLRDGYFTPKQEYGKICLPMPMTLEGIKRGFGRELCYQFAFESSGGEAELWLLEASTAIAGLSEPGAPAKWRAQQDLDRALCNTADEDSDVAEVEDARRQSGAVGVYLVENYGLERTAKLLASHSRNATVNATANALRAVMQTTPEEVFEAARNYRTRAIQ